jgi:hypothetical protein
MKTLTISEVVKHPSKLHKALKKGAVRITWKESKPNGKIIFSAIIKKEDNTC